VIVFPRFRSFLVGIWKRSALERDLDDEMRFHLENRIEQLMRSGSSPPEAQRRAQIEFGCVETYQDKCRESRHINWLDDFRQDLRYGWCNSRKILG
jgi:hypothetical protein